MSINKKQSSHDVAALAAALMNNKSASELQRKLAASVVAQARTGKQTGAKMEDLAAKALANKRSAPATRKLAASVLSQSNKER
jgi:hypothetical protein